MWSTSFPLALLALFASAQGRAVNISNTWVLPEEGFPVFYRYFRDRISWYEADAVCQFHHANLVTVDTTAQYDAVRAYLKELDISSAVWVGLIRSNPDGDFTWTDYRGLSSEGYWSSAPDARAAPLCAAADPVADYRWEARACGGPTVASFICELPVPQWALGNEGCMVRALPALTVLYLPESAAVQLTADCGLAGVKRVQCTGNVKREELLKELSCNDEDDLSSTVSVNPSSTMWSVTDTPTTDQESTTDEQTAEDSTTTEFKESSNTDSHVTETSTAFVVSDVRKSTKQSFNSNQYIKKPLNQDLNLDQSHSNIIVSNDIPHQDYVNSHPNFGKLEENTSYKHRLLHDEMTRLGNLETIFTQPTDHFVPPLVMAKSRISDDMTVLSLKEKHAQQVAEQQLLKHDILEEHLNVTSSDTSNQNTQSASNILTTTKMDAFHQTMPVTVNQNENKKDVKSSVPKKYIEKYNNLKGKIWRTIDSKIHKFEKNNAMPTVETSSKTNEMETTTVKVQPDNLPGELEQDSIIDLTVIIKEPGDDNNQKIFYSNHSDSVSKMNLIENVTTIHEKYIESNQPTEEPTLSTNPTTENSASKVTLNHEVIKITVINEDASNNNSTPIIFEVSTMVPVVSNDSLEIKYPSTSTSNVPSSSQTLKENSPSSLVSEMSTAGGPTGQSEPVTTLINEKNIPSEIITTDKIKEDHLTSTKIFTTTIQANTNNENKMTDAVTIATVTASVGELISVKSDMSEKSNGAETTTTTATIPHNSTEITVTEKAEILNHTEHNDEEQEHHYDMNDYYQSPLLSAANEPLHRPSRSRRPRPPQNRMHNFNPFRILG